MNAIAAVPNRLVSAIRRSFRQFLSLPLATVSGFIALSALVYLADGSWSGAEGPPGFRWLGALMGDRAALASLLATVASSIITVTSITFSLLLLAVQQGAGALTAQVTDQFMARRTNQFYFGYFVGLSVFVLTTLVTNTDYHRPVFAAALSLLLTALALCLIIVMIYNTIDQMRPEQIIQFIHDKVLEARSADLRLLAATRRAERPGFVDLALVRSRESGYVVGLDPARIAAALDRHGRGDAEIVVLIALGTYRAVGDPVFRLRVSPSAASRMDARERLAGEGLVGEILAAFVYDDGRDLQNNTAYGLHQLATIAWTSVSTSKSNPNPGLTVIQALRDIIAQWSRGEVEAPGDAGACIVYGDAAPVIATDALEAVIVVASESIQSQTLTEAIATLAILLRHVETPTAERLADVARRALSSLGEHVLTRQLEASLADLAEALTERGFVATAEAVSAATADLAASLGKLNSRSTRVPGPTA
ncbi:DUF2254 family protein [Methylobacterium terricola]|nr:DUF2254 family protein [Methylobacterium terricola]